MPRTTYALGEVVTRVRSAELRSWALAIEDEHELNQLRDLMAL
jgi:hypothetical protein